MRSPIRRLVDAALVIVRGFGMIACGMQSYKHTVEVTVVDPSHRLGPPPYDVSVFDHRMGRGAFFVSVTPGKTKSGQVRAGFGAYSDNFPKEEVPQPLDVQYTATPAPNGWHLVLRLLVPPNAKQP